MTEKDHLSPVERLFEGRVAALAGRTLGRAAALRLPQAVLDPVVHAYVAWFGVDLSNALVPPGGFRSFGEFFARRLKPGARPVSDEPDALVSPCDGVVIGTGQLGDGTASSLVVKGSSYRLEDLVADAEVARELSGGGHCTIYLHPRDYHRVHAPADAELVAVRHVPGARYPVAAWAERLGDDVLGKNERVAFDLTPRGWDRHLVMLMVAAFGVSDIERRAPGPVRRGEEIGAFRLGSTVVLAWPHGAVDLDPVITLGARVQMGDRLGRLAGTVG